MQVPYHLAGAQGHVALKAVPSRHRAAGAVDEPELAGDQLEDGDVGLGARAQVTQLRAGR